MSAKHAWTVLVPTLTMAFWAGCGQAPSRSVTGVVVPETDAAIGVGSYVPDIEFVDGAGEMHRLSSLYEDATIIVFVDDVCGKPSRELLDVETALRGSAALVRIYTGNCESEAECLNVLEDGMHHMVSLCDRKRILAHRYGLSGGSGVFLVDGSGRVKAVGSLGDLPAMTRSAERLALAAAEDRERLYAGN